MKVSLYVKHQILPLKTTSILSVWLKLTSSSSPPWEANSHSASREIFYLLWSTKTVTMFARACQWASPWNSWNQSTPSNPISVRCSLKLLVSERKITKLPHLFQSRTSWKGITRESAHTTGMQPAARASSSVGCPSLAPRTTKQNFARCKEELSSYYIKYNWLFVNIFTLHRWNMSSYFSN